MTMAKVRSKVANKKVQDLSKRKASGRVSKALNGTLTLRDRSSESGSVCLQDVGLFFAGHRKSNQVTAR